MHLNIVKKLTSVYRLFADLANRCYVLSVAKFFPIIYFTYCKFFCVVSESYARKGLLMPRRSKKCRAIYDKWNRWLSMFAV